MNQIYFILIPVSIIVIILGIHYFFSWWAWRKELRADEQKRKIVDSLLEVDAEDWINA